MTKKQANLGFLRLLGFFIKVVLPLIIGGVIYLFYRPKNLLMFEWLNLLGFTDIILHLRFNLKDFFGNQPEWIIFSLPDGLWVLSYTFLMNYIWSGEDRKIITFFISFGFFFSLSLELGQYFKIIPGSFDFIDLILINLGFLIPYLYEKHRTAKNQN